MVDTVAGHCVEEMIFAKKILTRLSKMWSKFCLDISENILIAQLFTSKQRKNKVLAYGKTKNPYLGLILVFSV